MRLRSNGLRPISPSITPSPARGAPQTTALIGALDGVIGELLGEARHRALVLGRDQQAARVLVEAMDDARPRLAADAGQRRAAMGDQRVDQRAVGIARRRMDDEPGRLVDDDEVLVLVDDVERDILALRLARAPAAGTERRTPRPV